MAEYRTVKMSFWTDPYVEGLTAEGKLLYLYLFTCPYTNNLGVLETTTRRIAYETGLDAGEVKDLLGDMERSGKVTIDGNCILLKHFIRHQCSTSPKIIASLQALFGSISSSVVRDALCRHYPKIFNTENMVSIPYEYHNDSVGIPSGEMEFKGEVKTEDNITCQNAGGFDGQCEGDLPKHGELIHVDKHDALNCPQQKILDAYHEILPELPRVVKLDDDLQKNVRTRWQEKRKEKGFTSEEDGVAYFRTLFEYVARNKWLMGRADGSNGWTCNYRWLMQRKNFAKVTSGNYAGWQE